MMKILGISEVDEGRRIYLPKSVFEELGLKENDTFLLKLGERVYLVRQKRGSKQSIKVRVGTRQRVYLPREILERLKLSVGSKVIFLREGKNITLSRLEERIK